MAYIIYSATGALTDAGVDATLSVVEFDVTMKENHNVKATVTDHPVEEGVNLSDHVHVERDKVSLECLVTNTPINDMSLPVVTSPLLPTRALIAAAPLRMAQAPITLEGTVMRQASSAKVKVTGAPPFGGYLKIPLVKNNPKVEVTPSEFVRVREYVGGNSLQAPTPGDRVRAVYEILRDLVRSGAEVMLITELRDYPSMIITDVGAPKDAMNAIIFSIQLEEVHFAETKVVDIRVKKTAEKRAQQPTVVGHAPGYAPPPGDEDIQKSWVDRGTSSIVE